MRIFATENERSAEGGHFFSDKNFTRIDMKSYYFDVLKVGSVSVAVKDLQLQFIGARCFDNRMKRALGSLSRTREN